MLVPVLFLVRMVIRPIFCGSQSFLRISFADFSQENSLARARPRFLYRVCILGPRRVRIILERVPMSCGFTLIAASSTTSGRDELLLVMTGQLQAIASKGGMPKPS